MLATYVMVMSLAGVLETSYWRIEISDGAVCSIRHDSDGQGKYGMELVCSPLTLRHNNTDIAVMPEHITLSEDRRSLRINPGVPGARLRWLIDFGPSEYFDRLTGISVQAPPFGPNRSARSGCHQSDTSSIPFVPAQEQERPALLTFISGGTGQCMVIESFKRVNVEQLSTQDLLVSKQVNPGNSTIIQTADRDVWIQVRHQKRQGASFSYVDNHLAVEFVLSEDGLSLHPYNAQHGIHLDGDERLPHFQFGRDDDVVNSLGGKQSLNILFNDFYRHAAFWYRGGHGISAWSAWGGQGHAYMNSPYRHDSRKSLMGQIIADDGYGHDGYAWTWGDQRGWPFPEGYDTRHFGINAMHIIGVQAYLGWSGEYDLVAGIDFGVQGYNGDDRVLVRHGPLRPIQLVRHQRYSQPFHLEQSIERLDLDITFAPMNLHGQDNTLEQRTEYPDALNIHGANTPKRLSDIPGNIAAQRFTAAAPFNTVGVFTCTWSAPGNRMRLRAFRWNNNYEATIAEPPLGIARIPDVQDNGFSCLFLDAQYPAGTELLLALDEPEAPAEGLEATAGFWHYPAPDAYPDMLLGSDNHDNPTFLLTCRQKAQLAMKGCIPAERRCIRTVTGIRLFPEILVAIDNALGERIYERTYKAAVSDDNESEPFNINVSLPPGDYIVHVTSKGATTYWHASHGPAALGGTAQYNGSTWRWLDRCRRAMNYQLEVLHGASEYILLLDGNQGDQDHSGVSGVSVGNNYYDILPFGYLDAYANAWFYDSLRAMAELERAYGNLEEAKRYETLREKVRARYNELFWTASGHKDGAARYIGCIDATGAHHDYGFSFVNTLAATVGLADSARGEAIHQWLDQGHAVNSKGKKEHIYHFEFAPRTTTIDNPDWWAVEQRYEAYPWGGQIQNGGANLYESYYDLRTRLFARGADDAYDRFMAILKRYAEPDRLTGGSPLYTGAGVQGGGTPGATGVMSFEFPETAMLAAIVVYGFLGADARADGLRIEPRLPSAQPFIRVENLYYHGSYFDIEAHHDRIHVSARPNENRFHYRIGNAEAIPPFSREESYDETGGILIVPITK